MRGFLRLGFIKQIWQVLEGHQQCSPCNIHHISRLSLFAARGNPSFFPRATKVDCRAQRTMTKEAMTLMCLIFLIFPTAAFGSSIDPGWYAAGGAGASKPEKGFIDTKKQKREVNVPHIAYKMSPVYDLKVGYRLNRFVRVDANAQYRNVRMQGEIYKRLRIKNASTMFNLYLDANNYSIVTPYITAGVGLNTLNISYGKKSGEQLFNKSNITQRAINIGVGIQVQIDENFGIDVIYKWTDLGMLKLKPNQNVTTPVSKVPIKETLSVREAIINFVIFM